MYPWQAIYDAAVLETDSLQMGAGLKLLIGRLS